MTTPMDNIYAAAAAAQAAVPAAQAAVPAVAAAPQQTAVAVATPSAPITMENLKQQSGVGVDRWLKVRASGLEGFSTSGTTCESVRVKIDMTEHSGFRVGKGVRFGDPANYKKTFDGVNCASGGTWAAAVQEASQIEASRGKPFKGDYPLVELGATLLQDAKDLKGAVLEKAGVVLGLATSVTNWKHWCRFYEEVSKAGLLGAEVEVEIGYTKGEKAGVQPWGLYTFKLIGEYFEAAE